MALTVLWQKCVHDTVFACQGVLMPDIEVQITTLVRIALHKLRDAREDGNPILIHAAQQRFDALVDKLPRSSSPKESK